jgi:4-amino-4-deoxy-L-arabinose transferase-like glycosyltransferase
MTLFPWSAFVPFAVYATARARRRGDGLVPMLLAWLCGGFLFFSMSSAKLPSYVLPLAPAAALLLAMAIDLPEAGPATARWAIWTLAALALAAVALPVRIGSELSRDAIVIPIFALLSGALALAGGLIAWKDHHVLAPSLAVVMGSILLGLALLAPPRLADARSTRTLVRDGALASLPGALYIHRILRPSLSFYLDRTPVVIGRGSLLLRTVEAGSSASVVLEESRRRIVVGLLARGFRVVARSGGLLAMHRPAPARGPA